MSTPTEVEVGFTTKNSCPWTSTGTKNSCQWTRPTPTKNWCQWTRPLPTKNRGQWSPVLLCRSAVSCLVLHCLCAVLYRFVEWEVYLPSTQHNVNIVTCQLVTRDGVTVQSRMSQATKAYLISNGFRRGEGRARRWLACKPVCRFNGWPT